MVFTDRKFAKQKQNQQLQLVNTSAATAQASQHTPFLHDQASNWLPETSTGVAINKNKSNLKMLFNYK